MLRSLGSVFAVVMLVACTSAEEEAAPKYGSVDALCEGRATEECQVATKCGSKLEACVAARKATCMTAAAASQTGTRAYRAKQGETCVTKAKETYAKSTVTVADAAKLEEVCQRAFQGTRKQGESCSTTYDCDGELVCDKGACGNKVEKKAGEFCGNPGEVCAAGSYCVANAQGALQCTAKKGKGEACDAKAPCVEDLRCTATCATRFSSGDACTSSDECGADTATYCDPVLGNKCGPGFIAAPGAPACKACQPGANPALCGFGA